MKKLCLKLLCVALPFLLYFGVFVAFDPADYFGVNHASTAGNSVVTRVKRFVDAPQNAIILGDSRMAHFDMDLVREVSGRAWSNLAFGGASMNESIDLFWLAVQQNPAIDAVVFEASFYTLRQGDTRNRTEAILTAVRNPAAYLFNFNYNVDMLQNILEHVKHWRNPNYVIGEATDTGRWAPADYLDETGAPLPYRRNLIGYAATLYTGGNLAKAGVLPAVETAVDDEGREYVANARALVEAFSQVTEADSAYSLHEDNLAALLEVAAYCKENNITLTFVLPPVDGAIREYVLEGLELWPALARIKSALSATGARVLDYEYEPAVTFSEDQFYDGFHLDIVKGLPQYTEILFKEVLA